MATRSFIGKQNSDGSINYIYCHWDGYPSHNGVLLRDHYTTEEKVEALLNLGDLSSLGQELGEKQDFGDRSTQKETWCLAYRRDRGDTGGNAGRKSVTSMKAYYRQADCYIDYVYVFSNGEWKCYNTYGKYEMDIPKKELEASN
jgi:hypothetical protein